MWQQIKIWQFIEGSLHSKLGVVLLYVLESKGSSPGRGGFCMAINDLYDMSGSIGGGMMEYKLVELAKDLLKNNEPNLKQDLKRQIHSKSAPRHQSGMICSGEQTVFLYKIQPANDSPVIAQIIQILAQNGNAVLQLSPAGLQCRHYLSIDPTYFRTTNTHFEYQSDKEWHYEEKIGYANKLFIIGGGHCALALSRLMQQMDFYMYMYEDRPQLNTFLKNNFVHEKIALLNYAQLADLIPSGENHYVVIMTFGYRTDDIALRALLHKKPLKYLGLLGSRSKINQLFDELKKNNPHAETALQRISAPAGIAIKSQTPEEIAISIAAEIIAIKNG